MKTAPATIVEEVVQASTTVVSFAAEVMKRVARRHRILDEIAQNRMNKAHVSDMLKQYNDLQQQLDSQYMMLQKSLNAH